MSSPRPDVAELKQLAENLKKDPILNTDDFINRMRLNKFNVSSAKDNTVDNLKATMICVSCAERWDVQLLRKLTTSILGEEDLNIFLLANVEAALTKRRESNPSIPSLRSNIQEALKLKFSKISEADAINSFDLFNDCLAQTPTQNQKKDNFFPRPPKLDIPSTPSSTRSQESKTETPSESPPSTTETPRTPQSPK